jgi:hypothetical protein
MELGLSVRRFAFLSKARISLFYATIPTKNWNSVMGLFGKIAATVRGSRESFAVGQAMAELTKIMHRAGYADATSVLKNIYDHKQKVQDELCEIAGRPKEPLYQSPAVAIVSMLGTLRKDRNITKAEADAWVAEYVGLTGNDHVLSLYRKN